jgi:hypothetical protein
MGKRYFLPFQNGDPTVACRRLKLGL